MKAKHRTLLELIASGFKIRTRMKEDEFIDWCKLGVTCGEMDAIAKKYREYGWKDWAAALQTAVTKADRVLNERLAMLDDKAIRAVINRRNNCKMVISIDYRERITPEDRDKERITVTVDDFEDMVEMSLIQTCEGCQRRDHLDCKYYGIYTKLCVPVINDEGEQCPYQYDMFKAQEAGQMSWNNEKLA